MTHFITLLLLSMDLPAQSNHTRFLPAQDCALRHTRIPKPGGSWQDPADWIGPIGVLRSRLKQRSYRDTCLRCHTPVDQYPRSL